jgi:two-component system, chemotaxis family, chemotaxis protein CheY
VRWALQENEAYDLICLNIMMPVMDGQQALVEIRKVEEDLGVTGPNATKVIMVTVFDDSQNIMKAFRQGQCEAYMTKPLDREKLLGHIQGLGLIEKM